MAHPSILRLTSLFAAAALTGCASEVQTGLVLLPGETAHATIFGDKPQVIVEVPGMESVDLVMQGGDGRTESLTLQGLVSHRWPGSVLLELTNRGTRPSHVTITARQATGIDVDKNGDKSGDTSAAPPS